MSNIALQYFQNRIITLNQELNRVGDELREAELNINSINNKISELKAASHNSDNIFVARNFKENTGEHIIQLEQEKEKFVEYIKQLNSNANDISRDLNELTQCRQEIGHNLKFYEDGVDDRFSDTVEGIDIIKIQEAERERIAADIHDSVIQQLSALVYKTEFCSRLIDTDRERVRVELEVIEKIGRLCIKELRDIIYDLHPMELKDLGLKSAIIQLVERMQKINENFTLQLSLPENCKEINDTVGIIMLRNIQELCINSIKHSQGSNIYIKVFFRGNKVYLDVSDDGIGFKNKINNTGSYGLSLIKERVTLLNGRVTFGNRKEGGSCVKIVLPVSME